MPDENGKGLAVRETHLWELTLSSASKGVEGDWLRILREHAVEMHRLTKDEADILQVDDLEAMFDDDYLRSLRDGNELQFMCDLGSGIGQGMLIKLWRIYTTGTWRNIAPADLPREDWTLGMYAKKFMRGGEYSTDIAHMVERVLAYVHFNAAEVLPSQNGSAVEFVIEQLNMREMKRLSQYMVASEDKLPPHPLVFKELLEVIVASDNPLAEIESAIYKVKGGVDTIHCYVHNESSTVNVYFHAMTPAQYAFMMKKLKGKVEVELV